MKKLSFIRQLLTYVSLVLLLSACDKEENFYEVHRSGSPLAENILPLADHQYEYNGKGLVTKIIYINKQHGVENTTRELVATISYPQSDRAVMVYTGDYLTTTYTFAFGENHFAHRVLEMEPDGDTYMTKFSYDNDGHATFMDDGEEKLKMEWTNGNLTKIKGEEYDATTVLTYSDRTDFEHYNMSPFLFRVQLGPFMPTMDNWFERGMKYALYIGFVGKPCRNLPKTMVSSDNINSEPEHRTFNYIDIDIDGSLFGMWTLE